MNINSRTGQPVWPWGIALLRIVVGIVFVMHGQQKLFEMGVGGVSGFFASLVCPRRNLPRWASACWRRSVGWR